MRASSSGGDAFCARKVSGGCAGSVCRVGVQLEAGGGGATVITLNPTEEPKGIAAAVRTGMKAGLGHISEPSPLSVPKARVWGLGL